MDTLLLKIVSLLINLSRRRHSRLTKPGLHTTLRCLFALQSLSSRNLRPDSRDPIQQFGVQESSPGYHNFALSPPRPDASCRVRRSALAECWLLSADRFVNHLS
jgi:hypothetical protein